MIYRFLKLIMVFFVSISMHANFRTNTNKTKTNFSKAYYYDKIVSAYETLNSNNCGTPKYECFSMALEGYYNLKEKGLIKKDILTVIDFSMSSTRKRLWVIDMTNNKVLFNSYVSHGMNSGGEYASKFSNADSSNKSSLGFYATGEMYQGKHGLSLKLDGLERGINNNARKRSVVVHGADYADASVFKSQKMLGRSQGCPAIPEKIKTKLIKKIKGKSCLFIYYPARSYEIASKLISQS
jgi:L,D-transpeptidase catalytic domain